MSAGVLLWFGIVATVVFTCVILVEGARRSGYDPSYHTGSELELGPGGWVVRASFLLLGAGMVGYAVGVNRVMDAPLGATLLAVFAVGSMLSGVFVPDPVRGFPPGSASRNSVRGSTWHARLHDAAGPVMFLALFGACLAIAGQLRGGWAIYTVATAAAGFGLTVWTALAYRRDAANTGLVQRGLLGIYFVWIVTMGIHLSSG